MNGMVAERLTARILCTLSYARASAASGKPACPKRRASSAVTVRASSGRPWSARGARWFFEDFIMPSLDVTSGVRLGPKARHLILWRSLKLLADRHLYVRTKSCIDCG